MQFHMLLSSAWHFKSHISMDDIQDHFVAGMYIIMSMFYRQPTIKIQNVDGLSLGYHLAFRWNIV